MSFSLGYRSCDRDRSDHFYFASVVSVCHWHSTSIFFLNFLPLFAPVIINSSNGTTLTLAVTLRSLVFGNRRNVNDGGPNSRTTVTTLVTGAI
jgi:hypothetical protein